MKSVNNSEFRVENSELNSSAELDAFEVFSANKIGDVAGVGVSCSLFCAEFDALLYILYIFVIDALLLADAEYDAIF